MKTELDAILSAVRDWETRGVNFALATVVGVRGSTYRGLGARQLISADGTMVGTVSGGCLDQDLTAAATDVINSGTARIVEFDLTADDEAIWGWGIGCNGVTVVLIEPAPAALALAEGLERLRHHDDGGVLIQTVAASGKHWFPWDDAPAELRAAADVALSEGRSSIRQLGSDRYLFEIFGGPPRLLVCGAGHDAVPLVRMGAELGFEVLVVDDRRPFLTGDRFPEATTLIATDASSLATAVDLDPRVYAVLITHNYLRDLAYLRSLLGSGVSYIGALGPGDRLTRLLDDLHGEGVTATAADLAKIHGPAGLDIGADGPLEIAWSILTEILAVRRNAKAGFLRDRKGPTLSYGGTDAAG